MGKKSLLKTEDNVLCVQVYFSFLQSWIFMLQSLPEGSQDLKSALEDEWDFTRKNCIYIIGGEAEAGKRFRWDNPERLENDNLVNWCFEPSQPQRIYIRAENELQSIF